MRKNTMHLFAGGGGGILGDLILGHTPIVAVEWDKYACKVLRERVNDGWFEGMHVYEGDVRLFNPSEYAGRVDCIHAGFPCQDISVAGKQAGVGEDTRSGLYREVLRIADMVRPRELFMENVSAILSNGLGTVLADLSARGYSARWMCLRASDVGANHHRDRWWLLARKVVADTKSERIGGGERDVYQKNGRQDGQLCKQCVGAGSESENMAKSSRRSDISSHAEHIVAGRREQFAEGVEEKAGCANMADTTRELRNRCRQTRNGWDKSANNGSVFPDTTSIGQSGSRTHEQSVNNSQAGNRETDRVINIREAGQIGREFEPELGGVVDGVAAGLDSCWWDVEPNVGRVTNVSKDRAAQLKALGNGQVPLQMAVAYSILEELFNA